MDMFIILLHTSNALTSDEPSSSAPSLVLSTPTPVPEPVEGRFLSVVERWILSGPERPVVEPVETRFLSEVETPANSSQKKVRAYAIRPYI